MQSKKIIDIQSGEEITNPQKAMKIVRIEENVKKYKNQQKKEKQQQQAKEGVNTRIDIKKSLNLKI